MNRTGLFIALSLALVIGVVFGLYPELDLKLAALFYDRADQNISAEGRATGRRSRAMPRCGSPGRWCCPRSVALAIKIVRPDRPLLVSGRAIIFLLVTLVAVRRHSHQSRLQELLGPAASGGGDGVQHGQFDKLDFVPWWDPRGGCALELLVLLRRGRDRVLDLCAGRAGAAGVAAARLCRGDRCSASPPACCAWPSAGTSSPTSPTAGLVTFS